MAIAAHKGLFYEQVAVVKVCFFSFIEFRSCCWVKIATHVVLHRVSIRTHDELSFRELGADRGSLGDRYCYLSDGLEGKNSLTVIGTRGRRNR